jgi:hypothetical protein
MIFYLEKNKNNNKWTPRIDVCQEKKGIEKQREREKKINGIA